MPGILEIFGKFTENVSSLLALVNIQPDAYSFLFPPNIEASTRIQTMVQQNVFPTIPKLAPAFLYMILLSLVRLVLQKNVFGPLAVYLMRIKFTEQEESPEIEMFFSDKRKKYEAKYVQAFLEANHSFKIGHVNRYLWNRRRNAICFRKTSKFGEAFWRFIFYSSFCGVGYLALFSPEKAVWIDDTKLHWQDWPFHPMSSMLDFYYQVELGCYLHQLLWTEIHRSDATEMMIHHLTTIGLIVTSYLTNFTRVGASILLLHDTADIFLESAKVFNYVNLANKHIFWLKATCDSIFVVFALTFVYTRLYLYPRQILHSVFFEANLVFGRDWIGYWMFAVMLTILQLLHIFWFYLIARMVFKMITTGVETDERSDTEEDETEEHHQHAE